ncbi:MAG: hypothetical protein U9Q84_00505, partial [Thermodesulfobacteriota bacterium]|nr:hypothetical protein [Thermodesulfobacteriota bacterium]
EAQEDDAFENGIISGRGFVGMDIAPDPKRIGEIQIMEISVPPREIRLDPAGQADDLSDHRYILWEKWLTFEDFKIRYPKYADKLDKIINGQSIDLDFIAGQSTGDVWDNIDSDNEYNDYETPLDFNYYDRSQGRVRVIHMEYWEEFNRYYGYNPVTGGTEEFDQKNLKALKKRFPDFEYVTLGDKKVKWFQFVGDEVLYDGESPIPFDGFSIMPCFAYKDKSQKSVQHFGVVRLMKDPQKEVNKRWSQTLNLLMQQSQGGYFATPDAPVDQEQWDASINEAGETTWVNTDAFIGGQPAKFMRKELPQLPQASLVMKEQAQDILKHITGINPDLLGQDRGRQEPGVVLRLRQQQGLTILSRLFKNFTRMKKMIAERRFAIIMAYMPDNQLQRILGENDKYIFRNGLVVNKEEGFIAPIRNLRDMSYNISMREAPGNLTKTMSELSIFLDMMSKGFPVDPTAVIEKLDLSASEKAKWLKYIEQQQQSQQQMMQQKIQLEQGKVQGKMQADAAKLQVDAQNKQQKLMLDAQKIASDKDTDLKKLDQQEREDRRDYGIDLAELDLEERQLVLNLVEKLRQGTQERTRNVS